MAKVWKISEAASIALHAITLLAAKEGRMMTAKDIAFALKVSENHLSKVLQRLARAGLVKAVRGPGGGFEIARPGNDITLLEVYEAIEGPLSPNECLLGSPICDGKNASWEDCSKRLTNRSGNTWPKPGSPSWWTCTTRPGKNPPPAEPLISP